MTYDKKLPEGTTCANCVSIKLCSLNVGVKESDTSCYFFPSSFVNRGMFCSNAEADKTNTQDSC